MASINLLPQDVVTSHKAAALTSGLKVLSVIMGIATLGIGFALGGYFFYRQKALSDLQVQYNTYKSQVLGLEATENSLILVRDRLTKIASIYSNHPYNHPIENANDFLSSLPEGVTAHQFTSSAGSQIFILAAADSKALLNAFNYTAQNPKFQSVVVRSLGYNTQTGYQMELDVN